MIYILFFLILTYFMLTKPEVSLYYAFHGLTLWYSKMVPALLPFMILSGTVIRMQMTHKLASLFQPVFKRIFRCRPEVSYGILIGFLCGFPMGAKTAVDLLRADEINHNEAEFLLSFCNNIGPVYFCSFVIPTLQLKKPLYAIAGMYGIPLIYGILLRYTCYRKVMSINTIPPKNGKKQPLQILTALDDSVRAGINSITMLCGYMVVFNLLNMLPHIFFPSMLQYIAPFLEITGGIGIIKNSLPIYILILLPFGGFSCIAQTNSIIKDEKLSISKYIQHKTILTAITAVYYMFVNILVGI